MAEEEVGKGGGTKAWSGLFIIRRSCSLHSEILLADRGIEDERPGDGDKFSARTGYYGTPRMALENGHIDTPKYWVWFGRC